MCGGARSTLGRALRRGGGRWGSPARRPRLSQPERSERGRELAALLGAQAECHPRPGRRAEVAKNGSRARGVVVSTDPISVRRFRYERSDPRRSSATQLLRMMTQSEPTEHGQHGLRETPSQLFSSCFFWCACTALHGRAPGRGHEGEKSSNGRVLSHSCTWKLVNTHRARDAPTNPPTRPPVHPPTIRSCAMLPTCAS